MKLAVGNLNYLANAPDEEEVIEKKEKKPRQVRSNSNATKEIPVTINDACLDLNFENKKLNKDQIIYIDTETTGLLYRNGDVPWMVSMCDDDLNSWCGLWPIDPYTRQVKIFRDNTREFFSENVEEWWTFLKEIVEDKTIIKGFFNGKFDIRNLGNIGINFAGPSSEELPQGFHEISIAARLYHTDLPVYKLKPLAKRICGLGDTELDDLKKITLKLRRKAKKAGWKVFDPENDEVAKTNSAASKEKVEPDYWLTMYAHLLLDDPEEIELCRTLAEEYCRKDTLRTARLGQKCFENFEKIPSKKKFYALEMQIHPIVMEMEDIGIMVNVDQAKNDKADCEKKAKILLREIQEFTGDENFNPDSPEHFSRFLFSDKPNGLGLPPTEMTTKGSYCKTGFKDIQHFAGVPFVQDVWNYKAQNKAVTLFFDKYIANIHPYKPVDEYQEKYFKEYQNKSKDEVGIIHPEINQGNVRTFRFSMSNPNLQQAANPETSARGANVVQVRSAFRPRPGYTWYLYDYSGQELRLLGGLMQIPEILEAVKEAKDIPTELGNKTWGGKNNEAGILQVIDSCEFSQLKPSSEEVAAFWRQVGWDSNMTRVMQNDEASLRRFVDKVFAEYKYDIVKLEKILNKKTVRTRTKMCLYGKAYGAGVHGVVGLLRCQPDEAKTWLKELDTAFPRMKKVGIDWTNQARQDGFIENAYGRRMNVDPEFAYKSINYRIQCTAADMMKISMLKSQHYLRKYREFKIEEVRMAITVHDELAFEIRNDLCYKWLLRDLKFVMEDPWHEQFTGIPMKVEINKCTERWDIEREVVLDAA